MKAKVIVHNHWDREWFATEDITSSWLKEVFIKVKDLCEKNPQFTYVMDGQTAVIEDLLIANPELGEDLRKLVETGRILIGPYYIQIDWRIPGESAILKNLELGVKEAERFGKCMKVGWLLDNFGHVSQEPQIHRLFGINKVFLWRGVSFPEDNISQEFIWKGSDGSAVQAIFLIGGYRNLYNLKETRDIADKRLKHEIKKLEKFSKSDEILLLDGYDIDLSPEDPSEYVNVELATPESFPEKFPNNVSVLFGELLSGRYACTFPGTLSTRVYLKLESDLVEKLLKTNDLLSVLNGEDVQEVLWRDFLKTLAHDNICGVCVDKVHENMDRTYRRLYFYLKGSIEEKMKKLASKSNLEKGLYVFSLSPFDYDHWYCDGERTLPLKTSGVGFFKVVSLDEREESEKELSWKNDYYEAYFEKDGVLVLNGKRLGILKLFEEKGDTYTTSTEETDFSVSLKKIGIILRTSRSMVVEMERIVDSHSSHIETRERIIFDETPLVKWNVTLITKGKNYKLSIIYETGQGKILSKMPFDVVERAKEDDYLLPEVLPENLRGILLAARETGAVREFPFQGFIALYDGKFARSILAQGLREYWVEEGKVNVTLVRSVEWIAKDVKNRIGDAGPLMYVPGAKCEGTFSVKLAFMEIPFHPRSKEFFRWYSLFENPPLLLDVKAGGNEKEGVFFKSELPWIGVKDRDFLWVYNPYLEEVDGTKPLQISSRRVHVLSKKEGRSNVFFLNFPKFPVLNITSKPEEDVLNTLKDMISKLDEEISELAKETDPKSVHRYLSLTRTKKEIELSLLYLQDVKEKARELNEFRMRRRTYDYVLELLESEEKA
ncbi:alpha-mannosidase [Thermotoga sp. KOL6]|uniref:glycoside hydrolase family 38 N-terminal domain-containing protein n=1 Tax=Thermotoga sp. KOL6 TaxID=126741 RepID=UPI000C774AD8|nr:alpha-mannosidase [Thermotoga sp. KOL6]PLV59950.1 alpha-mannosidase [Thermotoga sp. KOL6]